MAGDAIESPAGKLGSLMIKALCLCPCNFEAWIRLVIHFMAASDQKKQLKSLLLESAARFSLQLAHIGRSGSGSGLGGAGGPPPGRQAPLAARDQDGS